jgi:hypothetical protein
MLNRHNVLEHDASLRYIPSPFKPCHLCVQILTEIRSRSDAYFGNNHVCNQSIFNQTTQWWTGATIDRDMMANAKVIRMLQSRATNPTYRFTSTTEAFSIGEILAPFVVLGDKESVLVNKTLVEYFFGELHATRIGQASDFWAATGVDGWGREREVPD